MLEIIQEDRKKQPKKGCRKLYLDISDQLVKNGIKMGRDAVYRFLRERRLLVRKSKLHHVTTYSKHHYYKSPNLIKDLIPTGAEQVWVADITYLQLADGHAYLALVTDLYSKRIVGYQVGLKMPAKLVINALKMGLDNRMYPERDLIHHSDRGIQYCCPEFTQFALLNDVRLSNTQQSDPYENAVAERVNGILKYEFGLKEKLPNLETAQKMVAQAVAIYNSKRRHMSLDMQTPDFAHRNEQHQYKKYSLNV